MGNSTLNELAFASTMASGASSTLFEFIKNLQTRINKLESIINLATASAPAAVHNIPDVNISETSAPYDLASSIIFLNDLKAQYNVHRADTDAHDAADATNVVTSADATDLASCITLINEMKGDYNAHCANGTAHDAVDTHFTLSAANASDLPTLLVLGIEMQAGYNGHIGEDNSKGVLVSDSIRDDVLV